MEFWTSIYLMRERSTLSGINARLRTLRIGASSFLIKRQSIADEYARKRGWISAAGWAGVEIEEFPTLKKWEDRMWARPATKKGANVPEPYRMKELLADKAAMEKHAAQVR